MPKSIRIPRRSFLCGLGGAAVALPFLEAMLPRRAWAAPSGTLRYCSMFAGVEQRACIPSGSGPDYTLPPGFDTPVSVADHVALADVREHVTIVSGLAIPSTGPDGITPPGGKTNPHHGNIMMPLWTGRASTNANNGRPTSASADQILADALQPDTYFRSLEYQAQAHGYRGTAVGIKAQISFEADGTPRVPQSSPHLAWEAMFTNFAPSDPADLQAREALLARRLSVLDLVKERSDALASRVSTYDRQRLERHFDEIRGLELRLAEIPDTSAAGCNALPEPGADPQPEPFANTEHGGTTGYANEDARARVFLDLLHMAFVCDLTRIGSLIITNEQSVMSIEPLFGAPYEMHDVTHNDIPNRQQVWDAITSWHAGMFASLVQRLADTPDATGGTLLDSTIVVLCNSGGQSGHGGNNMAFPVAGCPSVLRMGTHVDASGHHPGHLFQTALHALGVDHAFGDVPGTIDALLV